jgi:chemotaxis protein MotB
MAKRYKRKYAGPESNEGEFLWLISLSDMMMLLFVFFVVLFSFASKKLSQQDYQHIVQAFGAKSDSTQTPVDQIQAHLLKWVTDKKLRDSVDVVRKEDSLILEIKEKLLFETGKASLKPESLDLIPALKEALEKIPAPYRIGIEGHTDDVPVAGSDNWHLSTERALKVHDALGLAPDLESRTVIMGYGATRPLVPNHDDKGAPLAANQAQNRRVTIRIF